MSTGQNVVGVGLDDVGLWQVLVHQRLHPFTGDDIRAVLLTRVQLYTHVSRNISAYLLIGIDEPLGREVTREIHHGLIARALLIGNILTAVGTYCLSECAQGKDVEECSA